MGLEKAAGKAALGKEANVAGAGWLARFSWAGYDFANTIYSFVVLTLAGARYFDAADANGELLYGIAFFASMVSAGFIVPMIGAVCDRIGFAKLGVIIMTALTLGSMVGMALTLNIALLAIFLFIGNISYQSSLVLYDTLLPVLIRDESEAGKLSGLGVGLGYLGSIAAVGFIMAFVPAVLFKQVGKTVKLPTVKGSYLLELRDKPDIRGDFGVVRLAVLDKTGRFELLAKTKGTDAAKAQESIKALKITKRGEKLVIENTLGKYIRLTFSNEKFADAYLWGALLFFLTTLPFVFFVPERKIGKKAVSDKADKNSSFKHVLRTLKKLPRDKPLLFFLIGAFLCQDVLNTAIIFLSKVVESVFSPGESKIVLLLILVNLSGAVFGIILGFITDKLGGKNVLLISGASTTLALLIIVFLPQQAFIVVLILVVICGGLGIAGFWTAGRKLLIDLAPAENISEYFGFYNLTKKLSVFGALTLPILREVFSSNFTESVSYRLAIAAQIPFLLLGMLFLFLIKMPKKQGNFPKQTV